MQGHKIIQALPLPIKTKTKRKEIVGISLVVTQTEHYKAKLSFSYLDVGFVLSSIPSSSKLHQHVIDFKKRFINEKKKYFNHEEKLNYPHSVLQRLNCSVVMLFTNYGHKFVYLQKRYFARVFLFIARVFYYFLFFFFFHMTSNPS